MLIDRIKEKKDTTIEEHVEFLFHEISIKAIEKASEGFAQMSWDVSGYSSKVIAGLLEKLKLEGIDTSRENYGKNYITVKGW